MLDRLTQEQIDAVFHAARPLPPTDQAAFFVTIVRELDGQEIGDGLLRRVVTDVQRRFMKPVALNQEARTYR